MRNVINCKHSRLLLIQSDSLTQPEICSTRPNWRVAGKCVSGKRIKRKRSKFYGNVFPTVNTRELQLTRWKHTVHASNVFWGEIQF